MEHGKWMRTRWIIALAGACVLAALWPESGRTQAQKWAGCGDPTPEEQHFLECLNAARADPAGAQTRLKTDLTAGGKFQMTPRHPLVMNCLLTEAARRHSRAMNDQAFFGHLNPEGQGPGVRLRAAGYKWRGYSENLAAAATTPMEALANLLIDEGIPDLGHRVSLLGLTEQTRPMDEVGIGIHTGSGPYKKYYTIELATDPDPGVFLTGVVYRDTNKNNLYDPGEGLPSIKVEVTAEGVTAVTNRAGGYGIPIDLPGSLVVTASGAGMAGPMQKAINLTNTNAKLDFTTR